MNVLQIVPKIIFSANILHINLWSILFAFINLYPYLSVFLSVCVFRHLTLLLYLSTHISLFLPSSLILFIPVTLLPCIIIVICASFIFTLSLSPSRHLDLDLHLFFILILLISLFSSLARYKMTLTETSQIIIHSTGTPLSLSGPQTKKCREECSFPVTSSLFFHYFLIFLHAFKFSSSQNSDSCSD